MDFISYLNKQVTPLWPDSYYKGEAVVRRGRGKTEESRQKWLRSRLLTSITKYERAFKHFSYQATTMEIATFLGLNASSMAHTLFDLMEKTPFLTRKILTREEAKARRVRLSSNPQFLWTWDKEKQDAFCHREEDI